MYVAAAKRRDMEGAPEFTKREDLCLSTTPSLGFTLGIEEKVN